MTTRKEVAKILTAFKVHWPNMAEPNDDTFTAFHDVLQDIDFETLNIAAKKVISEPRPFAPSAGEWRAVAFALMRPEVPPALEAWGLLKKAVRDFDSSGAAGLEWLDYKNSLAGKATRALGWYDFWMSDVADEMSWRARFIECYNEYAKRETENSRDLPAVKDFRAEKINVLQAASDLARRLTAPVK